jgi:hypothetical protein
VLLADQRHDRGVHEAGSVQRAHGMPEAGESVQTHHTGAIAHEGVTGGSPDGNGLLQAQDVVNLGRQCRDQSELSRPRIAEQVPNPSLPKDGERLLPCRPPITHSSP